VTDKRFAALSANKQGNGDAFGILSLERKPFFVDLFFKLFLPLSVHNCIFLSNFADIQISSDFKSLQKLPKSMLLKVLLQGSLCKVIKETSAKLLMMR